MGRAPHKKIMIDPAPCLSVSVSDPGVHACPLICRAAVEQEHIQGVILCIVTRVVQDNAARE